MTPLTATLATGVAVGVGLALARAENRRRRARSKEREQLGLRPGETVAQGLHRMALAQVELVLGMLDAGEPADAGREAPDERAVHETRKAIKRLRALLRVLRGELGERAYEREDAALRQIARRLSGARDATVMLATLDGLIERRPRKLGHRAGVLALRRRVLAESERAQGLILADPLERAEVIGELQALRWRIGAWALPADAGVELVDAELQRLYREGAKRMRRAGGKRGKRGERTRALHRWRKRVKDLRYAAEMLERRKAKGTGSPATASRSPGRRRRQRRLHEIAACADELGELLGEEHDLAVLAGHLRAAGGGGEGARLWRTGRKTRRLLLALIAQRRRKLQRRALRKGQRLFALKPKALARVARRAYEEGL